MAIKGIEAQLMVTRTTDYTKDSSTMLRKNELMQDYLAVQQRASEAREKQQVLRKFETENVKLRPDDDESRRSSGSYSGSAGKEREREEEETTKPGTVVMSEERLIDIKI